jgi:hypothetical protein
MTAESLEAGTEGVFVEVETNVFILDQLTGFLNLHSITATAYKVETFSA